VPFTLLSGAQDERQTALYAACTTGERTIFQRRRLAFLSAVARLLTHNRFAYGVGYLAGKVLRLIPKSTANPIDEVVDGIAAAKPSPALTKAQIRHEVIQQVLTGLDHQLWNRSRLIAGGFREFGMKLYVGLGAGALFGNKGKYVGQELGIGLGYDWDQEKLVFKAFHSASKTDLATAHLGVRAFFRYQLYAQKPSHELKTEDVRNWFLAIFPEIGRPFATESATSIAAGFHHGVSLIPLTGWLHWISLLNSTGVYTSVGRRLPLVKLTVSPADRHVHAEVSNEVRAAFRNGLAAGQRPVRAVSAWVGRGLRGCGRGFRSLAGTRS
jgi:hypothetical protein